MPKSLWKLFQDVCRPILADLERAASTLDHFLLETLLQEFLDVPAHTLAVRRGGRRNGRRRDAGLETSLHSLRNQRQSLPNTTTLQQPHHTPSVPPETTRQQAGARVVKRAVGLTLSNHASRAATALYQDILPDISPEIQRELVRLHPTSTSTLPLLPPDAPISPVLPDDTFVRIWKTKIATGAAAGVTGFTGDHGLPLLGDPHCLRALALLVQLIRNGQLNDRCRQLLLSCPLIAVAKRTSGIRPITIGESLYKMAATHALFEVESEAIDILGEDQFALQPGGPEVASLSLKAALETHTGASTDLENAFNTLDRATMLRSLYSQPRLAPLWRIAHWTYSQPVPLLLLDNAGFVMRTLFSHTGCLQGEPLSSLLFCLSLKPAIDTAKLAGGPDVKAVAITDDVTFLGPPDGAAVALAVESYKASTASIGMNFQGSKSCFITFHQQPLSFTASTFAATNQMRTESGCCIIGGTPMGPDRARVQAEALKIAEQSHLFFTALQHESMPIPVADRLLRLCGVPRLNYLSRVGLLGEYEDALSFFDEKVSEAAQAQAGLPTNSLSPSTSQQSAPLRNAGFAFRTYTNNIAIFSSLGAFSQAAPHIRRLCPHGLPPVFAASVQATVRLARERVGPDALPSLPPNDLPDDALLFYSSSAFPKLQRLLSVSAANREADLTLQSSSPAEAARYFANSAPCASSWLADPFSVDPMPDEVHAAACKLRRNQPLSPTSPATCYCGADLSHDPWHVLSHKGGPEATRRHDACVDVLEDWVHRVGGQAFVEPRQDFWEDRRRPDIKIVLGAQSYLIDVRITHPTAACWIQHACQGPLRATIPAANQKRRRFDALAAAEGSIFVPFILETHGGIANEARTFLNTLAKFAQLHSHVWNSTQARLGIRSALHKELFRGNLRVAHAVLQRCNPFSEASHRAPTHSPREDDDSDDDTQTTTHLTSTSTFTTPSVSSSSTTSTFTSTESSLPHSSTTLISSMPSSTFLSLPQSQPSQPPSPERRSPTEVLTPSPSLSLRYAPSPDPPSSPPHLHLIPSNPRHTRAPPSPSTSPTLPDLPPFPPDIPPTLPPTNRSRAPRSHHERTQHLRNSSTSESPPRGRSRTARPLVLRSASSTSLAPLPLSIGTYNFISHAQASLLALAHYGTQTQFLSRNGTSETNQFTSSITQANPVNSGPSETPRLRSSNTHAARRRSR